MITLGFICLHRLLLEIFIAVSIIEGSLKLFIFGARSYLV